MRHPDLDGRAEKRRIRSLPGLKSETWGTRRCWDIECADVEFISALSGSCALHSVLSFPGGQRGLGWRSRGFPTLSAEKSGKDGAQSWLGASVAFPVDDRGTEAADGALDFFEENWQFSWMIGHANAERLGKKAGRCGGSKRPWLGIRGCGPGGPQQDSCRGVLNQLVERRGRGMPAVHGTLTAR
jgi:hypothetical protein